MDPSDQVAATDVNELVKRANASNERGAYEGGLRLADAAIARSGRDAAPWTTRGWALENLGRMAEAERAYATALQLDPDSLWAAVGLATVLEKTGRRAEASDLYREAADRPVPPDERSAALLEIAGWSCFKAGRNEEAQRLFRRALDLEPGRTAVRFDLALAMLAAGQEEAALLEYRRGLEEPADVASLRAHVGVALEDLAEAFQEPGGMDVTGVAELLRRVVETPFPER